MFKKYSMKWSDVSGCEHKTDFYVNSKNTRNGFMHRACVIGMLPRLDEMSGDLENYAKNDKKLYSSRVSKVSYCNRTWEYYAGQTCLSRLWEKLMGLKFVDMYRICAGNPFEGEEEPPHECITEADALFEGLSR